MCVCVYLWGVRGTPCLFCSSLQPHREQEGTCARACRTPRYPQSWLSGRAGNEIRPSQRHSRHAVTYSQTHPFTFNHSFLRFLHTVTRSLTPSLTLSHDHPIVNQLMQQFAKLVHFISFLFPPELTTHCYILYFITSLPQQPAVFLYFFCVRATLDCFWI